MSRTGRPRLMEGEHRVTVRLSDHAMRTVASISRDRGWSLARTIREAVSLGALHLLDIDELLDDDGYAPEVTDAT